MNRQYQIGDVVFQQWTITDKIGEGSFGKVYQIERSKFGVQEVAALKVISVPQKESEIHTALDEGMSLSEIRNDFYDVVEDIVKEIALMAEFKGTSYVVSYEDHEEIAHPDGIGWDILIRMEKLTPLMTYAYEHPFTRRDIIQIGIDICKALEMCQERHIIHRDIKPENIFVSKRGEFKLGDFGIARTVEKTVSGLSKKGTYNYMAPEVYRGDEYGYTADICSLGLVLYRLLNCNRLPFQPLPPVRLNSRNREEALQQRLRGKDVISLPVMADGVLGEIVCRAIAHDPTQRYQSAHELRLALEEVLNAEHDDTLIFPVEEEKQNRETAYASVTPLMEDKTQSVFGQESSPKDIIPKKENEDITTDTDTFDVSEEEHVLADIHTPKESLVERNIESDISHEDVIQEEIVLDEMADELDQSRFAFKQRKKEKHVVHEEVVLRKKKGLAREQIVGFVLAVIAFIFGYLGIFAEYGGLRYILYTSENNKLVNFLHSFADLGNSVIGICVAVLIAAVAAYLFPVKDNSSIKDTKTKEGRTI